MKESFYLRLLSVCCLFFLGLSTVLATHNRSGEIVVETLTDGNGNCGLTVRATIITYTKTSSVDADRDSLTICWGDDTCERVARANGPLVPPQGEPLENDIKFNLYIATHTYNGPATYVINFEDPNRNAGILNVNFPNSVSIEFYVENVFTLFNPVFSGCNNSPVLQVPPIDFACTDEVFTHNPGAFDVDGDSLVYELAVPRRGPGDPVPNFFFPGGMSINRITGDLVWDTPNEEGEFNVAINIISFRNGFPIDTMVRDMQIIVEDCDNDPPLVITDVDELCVIAGTNIEFDVTATAPLTDTDELVRLLGYGAPFNLDVSPATFLPDDETYQNDPLTRTFRWQTTCEHISSQPYNVVFRAVDDHLGDTTGLATLKTIRIKVVGPPPEDVQAIASSQQIEVSWELPYVCENAQEDFFRGFSVWRRINSDLTPLDTCITGLAGRGYTRISSDDLRDVSGGRYFFLDENVERGKTYCYRILAHFARRTANGMFFYNPVESLASEEVCVQLGRDVPLITKVDVVDTDIGNGIIDICWSKPLAEDLDTILNAGPYTYELLQAPGHTEDVSAFTPIFSVTAATFAEANDTCFTAINLNTVDQPYSYIVNFYVNGESSPLGASSVAGSLFLNATPSDRQNTLTWDELIPWENFAYTISRENGSGGFDELATISDPIYRDEGLTNNVEYCYLVRAQGTYNISGLPEPLINRSQIVCSTPFDNVPPCPPELTVTNLCDFSENCDDIESLTNNLDWINPATICPEFQDVAAYNVYYAPMVNTPFELIASINDPNELEFIHEPGGTIAGCYAVTAIDTVGNESAQSNIVCVDNCPVYELPNAFTPNGDSQNDLFVPTRNCFIAEVEFQVFNRWGDLVFETKDPALNWDGTNTSGDLLNEGTYFYKCQIFEQRVDGVVPSQTVLSGYIEMLKDNP
ncbi:MAG: gliding motility-associated C-terminal domain-containing protein [Bacteroidota bacterium]